MAEYKDKAELIAEIKKTGELFILEFQNIDEVDKNKNLEGVDKSPLQMIAYQLGWLNLLMKWDRDELDGKEVITPTPDYKWNKLGQLYEDFYKQYQSYSLEELRDMFLECMLKFIGWVDSFSEEELFGQDIRKWASSTPSKWAIWKWVHINTVAPFKNFRTKIRKWKKLNL